jgi:hypothetical protein
VSLLGYRVGGAIEPAGSPYLHTFVRSAFEVVDASGLPVNEAPVVPLARAAHARRLGGVLDAAHKFEEDVGDHVVVRGVEHLDTRASEDGSLVHDWA